MGFFNRFRPSRENFTGYNKDVYHHTNDWGPISIIVKNYKYSFPHNKNFWKSEVSEHSREFNVKL